MQIRVYPSFRPGERPVKSMTDAVLTTPAARMVLDGALGKPVMPEVLVDVHLSHSTVAAMVTTAR